MVGKHWSKLLILKLIFFTGGNFEDNYYIEASKSVSDRMSKRLSLLTEKCRQYSDPFRPESSVISTAPSSLGVEVVYLHGRKTKESTSAKSMPVASVCIPHKVKIDIGKEIYRQSSV